MDKTMNGTKEQGAQAVVAEKDLELMIKKYQKAMEGFKPAGVDAEEKERFRHLVKMTGFTTFHVEPNYLNAWTEECIGNKDWAGLCRITNQRFKSAALPNIYGGYHHEYSSWCVLEGISAGNAKYIARILPPELALVKNYLEPFAPAAAHLLAGLWYKDKKSLEEGISMGERFLTQKKPALLEKAMIAFLMDLLAEDMEKASQDLLAVCKNYRNFKRHPFGIRPFCTYAHGLYGLAQLLLPKEKFEKLQMPKHKEFLADYAKWLRECPEPDLSLYFHYPEEMKWVSEILEAPCARLVLHQLHLNDPNVKPKEREDWTAYGVKWVKDFADELWDAGVGHD